MTIARAEKLALIESLITHCAEINAIRVAEGEMTAEQANREATVLLAIADDYRGARDLERIANALAVLVDNHNYSYLDRGIGTATDEGKRWLEARAAIDDLLERKHHA